MEPSNLCVKPTRDSDACLSGGTNDLEASDDTGLNRRGLTIRCDREGKASSAFPWHIMQLQLQSIEIHGQLNWTFQESKLLRESRAGSMTTQITKNLIWGSISQPTVYQDRLGYATVTILKAL